MTDRPSAWQVAQLPVHACGTYVGTTALGPPFGVRCYTALENAIGIIGPPRTVKTMLMTNQVADFRGPVISLQTKASTYHDTWAHRAQRYGRVHLIDPEGLTGDRSTLRWAPQRGCAHPPTAASRAAALVTAAVKLGKEDGPLLTSQAGDLLRAFLLLADVAGRDMHDVHEWSQGPTSARRALTLMESDRHRSAVPPGWARAVTGVLDSGATRTTGAVFYALREAVGFMGDPAAAELCTPGPDEPAFDVRAFLAGTETVYLIATDREHNRIGPLLSAFVAYVAEEAMRIAGPRHADRGRLEPFLHISGDEAANTIPLDLPRLCADTGGRGIQVCWSAQSRSQLEERFGKAGADTVWNATTTKLQGSGSTVAADLRDLSDLSGTRARRGAQSGAQPGDRDAREPVMSLADGRLIPVGCAVLVHGDMRFTVVRVRRPWTRPDLLAARLCARGAAPPALTHVVAEDPRCAR